MTSYFENWKKFHLDTKRKNCLAQEYRNIILKRRATKCFKNWHKFSRKLSDQKATYKKMNNMADEFRQKILENRILLKLVSLRQSIQQQEERENLLFESKFQGIKNLSLRPICHCWLRKYREEKKRQKNLAQAERINRKRLFRNIFSLYETRRDDASNRCRLENLAKSYEEICLIKKFTHIWKIALYDRKNLQKNTSIALALLYQNRTAKIFSIWVNWTKRMKMKKLKSDKAFELHQKIIQKEWSCRLDRSLKNEISGDENFDISEKSLKIAKKYIFRVSTLNINIFLIFSRSQKFC